MPDQDRLEMIAEIARYYYEKNLSQAEIGRIFDISHSTVSRMLNEALEEKIVEVIIHYPFKTLPSLGKALAEKFNIKAAYVLPGSDANYTELVENLGRYAAKLLADVLEDGKILGISLGMAVAATVRHVKITKPMHVRVVRLQGATENEIREGTDLAQVLAAQMGNDAMIIPSPWVMKSKEARDLILQERSVQEIIRMAEKADIGLVGIGSTVSSYSTILQNKLTTEDVLKDLEAAGAVGEICGKYFDKNGSILDVDFNDRTISIELEKLRDFETVIGVAGSVNKARAMIAAMRGGFVNILVTDSDAARRMLELAEEE